MNENFRIGCGAGFSGDRFDPAIALAERGDLDAMVLECLAERTIAAAQLRRRHDPNVGYDMLLECRISKLLPASIRAGTRLITNMGAANPRVAALKVAQLAHQLGHSISVAAVTGDDVLDRIDLRAPALESGRPLEDYGEIVSANAYLGADALLPALATEAHVVVTGRVADASLFLAPLMLHFGWESADLDRIAAGIVIGHLLECAGQLCGGYFADPEKKDVPRLAELGFPYADVEESGYATFTKLRETGGVINRATATEQLLYEVSDPTGYLSPDVTVDFQEIEVDELRRDVVAISGARGKPKPAQLKVSVGYLAGYVGEGEISYAGTNAGARARLAAEIVSERLDKEVGKLRVDLVGSTSMHGGSFGRDDPYEVRLRIAARTASAAAAARVGEEVEALYTCGPAAGGGVRTSVREQIGIVSTLIDRDLVNAQTHLFHSLESDLLLPATGTPPA